MNKKLKVILIFLLGWLCGVLSIALIALLDIHRKGGSPLVEPKLYGDVKIYRWNSGDELENQMGLGDWMIIEKDKESFIALNFDKQKQFSGFSFWNRGKNIMGYAIPHKYKDHDSVLYGTLEQNLSWMDYNSDGTFDLQHNKNDNTKKILINDEWVETEAGSKKAVVKNGEAEIEYTFDHDEGKWLPITPDEMEEPL